MRGALALLLGVTGLVSLYVAWGPLSNLWADYKDSPDSTYLIFGLPFLAVALFCFASAVFMLRRP
jgi:hypothetical protein